MRRGTSLLAILVVVALVVGLWLLDGRDAGVGHDAGTDPAPAVTSETASDPSGSASGTVSDAGDPRVDPASGLPFVDLADLPPEAAVTVDLIDQGGPYPHDQDDGSFGNREGILPDRDPGYYREYTVETPGSDDRGARRIVIGAAGELYWTADHYQSFERIRR